MDLRTNPLLLLLLFPSLLLFSTLITIPPTATTASALTNLSRFVWASTIGLLSLHYTHIPILIFYLGRDFLFLFYLQNILSKNDEC